MSITLTPSPYRLVAAPFGQAPHIGVLLAHHGLRELNIARALAATAAAWFMKSSAISALLKSGAVKAAELTGHSHFDAMTKYWKLQGWGEYEAESPQDHEPYPDEWAAIQRTFFDGQD
jgi:hypothetical protein